VRDSRWELFWAVALVLTALPGALFFLFMVIVALAGISWERQAAGGNFDLLQLLLMPFYATLLAAAVTVHRRGRAAIPRRRPPFGVPLPAWVCGFIMTSCVLLSDRGGDVASASTPQRRELEATGCRNTPRMVSRTVTGKSYVVVYDRACRAAPRHTVNVSVLDQMEPQGAGNVFVAEAADGSAREARRLNVFAFAPRAGNTLEVRYDGDARVLSSSARLNELSIELKPERVPPR
jgi:hypothetical protein